MYETTRLLIDKKRKINDLLEELMACYFHILFDDLEEYKEIKLEDIYEVISGKTPKNLEKTILENGFPWITPEDVSKQKNKFMFRGKRYLNKEQEKQFNNKKFPEGTVLFTSGAPLGKVTIAAKELCTGNRLQAILQNKIKTYYIYFWFKEKKAFIESIANGTTFPELSINEIRELLIKFPDIELVEKFNNMCEAIFELQKNNEQEIRELMNLQKATIEKLN